MNKIERQIKRDEVNEATHDMVMALVERVDKLTELVDKFIKTKAKGKK